MNFSDKNDGFNNNLAIMLFPEKKKMKKKKIDKNNKNIHNQNNIINHNNNNNKNSVNKNNSLQNNHNIKNSINNSNNNNNNKTNENKTNENKNIENIQLNLFFYANSFKNEFERLRETIGFNNMNTIKTFKNNIINSLSELINKLNIKI